MVHVDHLMIATILERCDLWQSESARYSKHLWWVLHGLRSACKWRFRKKEIKSKTIFVHKFLEFCYFLVLELRNQHDCVEEQEEGIMNGDYIMGNENV